MSNFDIAVILIVGIGFVVGLFKGLVKELASLLAIVAGVYLAKLFSQPLSYIIIEQFGFSQNITQPLSYIIIFVIVAILFLLLARLVDKFFDAVSLSFANKILGALFGAAKYMLILSVLLNVFDTLNNNFHFTDKKMDEGSITYAPLLKVAPKLWDDAQYIKKNLKDGDSAE